MWQIHGENKFCETSDLDFWRMKFQLTRRHIAFFELLCGSAEIIGGRVKEGTAQSRDMNANSRSQAARSSCKMATSAKARRSFVNVSNNQM